MNIEHQIDEEKSWMTAAGYPAVICTHKRGLRTSITEYRTGYVGVPVGHHMWGDVESNTVRLSHPVQELTYHGQRDDTATWWFGWDDAHFEGEQLTLDEAIAECESLAEQLKAFEVKS